MLAGGHASLPEGVRLTVNPNYTDLARISDLLALVGMRGRDTADLERAMRASSDIVVALRNSHVVGFGRMISDETYYGSIWDVAVLPELQSRGIGTQVMELLMDRARARKLYMLGLFTGAQNREFYEGLGFTFHEDVYAMTTMSVNETPESEV